MDFDVCKKIIDFGRSEVFENWKTLAPITKDDFLDALRWLCEDPQDGGVAKDKMTREIGLTPDGIVKLSRSYGACGICAFYDQDGKLWGGRTFRIPCDDPRYADEDGKIDVNLHLSLSCRDRI